MVKKKQKKIVKKEEKHFYILPDLYDTISDFTMRFIFVLCIASIFLFGLYWFQNNSDVSWETNLAWNFHGINPILMLFVFVILIELLFIWIANNERPVDMLDIVGYKIMSIIFAAMTTLWFFSLVAFIKDIQKAWIITVVTYIGYALLIGIAIYVYLKINQWIAKKVG